VLQLALSGGAHRALGWLYVLLGATASVSGMILAAKSKVGALGVVCMFAMGTWWLYSTWMAVREGVDRNIANHRRWMVRSISTPAVAIVQRLSVWVLVRAGLEFSSIYTWIVYTTWLPVILVTEWLITIL
jgi:hypothetical protein